MGKIIYSFVTFYKVTQNRRPSLPVGRSVSGLNSVRQMIWLGICKAATDTASPDTRPIPCLPAGRRSVQTLRQGGTTRFNFDIQISDLNYMLSTLSQQTIIQLTNEVVNTILGVAIVALMTRALGTHGFGEYTTVTSYLNSSPF